MQVPDIEGSKEDRCELTSTPYGRIFINEVSIEMELLHPLEMRISDFQLMLSSIVVL